MSESAQDLLSDAIARFGIARFVGGGRGPAIIADVVGGARADLSGQSRALEIACARFSMLDLEPGGLDGLSDRIQAAGIPKEHADWGAAIWLRTIEAHGVAPSPPEVEPSPEQPTRSAPIEVGFNPVPIVAVAVVVLVVVLVFLFAG